MSKQLDIGYIDDIQINGLDKVDSFKKHFPDECEGKSEEEIMELASKRLKRGKNEEYYLAKAEQYEIQEKEKYNWNIEVANNKIGKMIEHLEKKVYEDGNEKMAVLSTLKELYKEKDLINGIQNHKITVNVNPIAPVVEKEKLKTYDENGNIVDGDFKEVENENNG